MFGYNPLFNEAARLRKQIQEQKHAESREALKEKKPVFKVEVAAEKTPHINKRDSNSDSDDFNPVCDTKRFEL